ncbi:hypothetical protein FM120_05575 [Sphingobacterium faecium PCAi_F2.5]|nr:hypothetical protein FM120_05575 [Sphingobacterium faecium PCAi_F2.5]
MTKRDPTRANNSQPVFLKYFSNASGLNPGNAGIFIMMQTY